MYFDPSIWTQQEIETGIVNAKAELMKIYRNVGITSEGNSFTKAKVAELEDLLHAYQICLNEIKGNADGSSTIPVIIS